MSSSIFTPDIPASKEYFLYEGRPIEQYAGIISTQISEEASLKG